MYRSLDAIDSSGIITHHHRDDGSGSNSDADYGVSGLRTLPIVEAEPVPCAGVGFRREIPAGAVSASSDVRDDLRDDDLVALLTAFYDRVGGDPVLAPYFAALDMAAHIPRIADFWATILFQSTRYRGNAFAPHREMPGLAAEHFARWLAAFEATVDARHAGPDAERAKDMAHRIAYSMQLRLGVTPFAPPDAR